MLNVEQLAALRQPLQFATTLAGQPLHFTTTWGLFSPREIDGGTRLLLEHISIAATADCLDFGCGYGAIGMTLARLAPRGRTLLIDKDFVAIEYAQRNLVLNQLTHAEVQLSNGFNHIDRERRFDVIASNIPAQVGKELLTLLLHDAHHHLRDGGQLYLVTVNGLRQFMQRNLNDVFGNYTKLKQGSHYTVARAQKLPFIRTSSLT
ncbi:class I SAM-dependent methyltransferase [Thiospirillum jenense]|uniref:Methyltransferase n=1 Tax=Thiospirillum jenense TaxID=1653858 RepID=A0A839HDZ4_9GAMM|nr:methyltransferase [Thiospirillum jenense]MBB1125397.1 methyltransferase [Thiospirillum jenense]